MRGGTCVCAVAVVGRQCSALESVPGWVEAPWKKRRMQRWGGGVGFGHSRGRQPLLCVSLGGKLERRWSKRGEESVEV